MATDQVIYLEKFIESTAHLPPELQRILNTIKDLDERSEDVGAQIQDNVELGLKGKLGKEEAQDLLERIKADQKLLVQFAEEKVELATLGYNLVDQHLVGVERDISALASELQTSVDLAVGEALGDPGFGLGGLRYEDGAGRGGALRRDYGLDGLESGRRTGGYSQSVSEDGRGTPSEVVGLGAISGGRRTSSAAGRRTPLAGGLDALGGADATSGGHIHKRRAASAAVHAATAAVAAMDEDEGADAFGTPAAPQGLAVPGAYSTPFIPGLEQAAEQPQAPGRLLSAQDIGPGLIGRRAELYWPDNNLWYLIEIRAVNLGARTASILYTTGEVEELDLDEIVKEGHLSLISTSRLGARA